MTCPVSSLGVRSLHNTLFLEGRGEWWWWVGWEGMMVVVVVVVVIRMMVLIMKMMMMMTMLMIIISHMLSFYVLTPHSPCLHLILIKFSSHMDHVLT